MGKLKFVLVGCGRIGLRHAEHIKNVGQLIAYCDVNHEALAKLSKLMPESLSFDNFEELLKANLAADVICICTPNYFHAPQSILALKAGYNVLCEKPMAMSVAECVSMNNAAKKSNKKLFVVKQNRFNPPVVQVKEWLDTGVLGKVYSIQVNGFWNRNKTYFKSDWTGSKDKAGGILHTQFSHFIDITQWLFGEIDNCNSICENRSGRTDFEFSDTITSVAKFKSGVLGNFHFSINSFDQNMEGSITILAEKGTVKIGGRYLNRLEYFKIQGIDIIDLSPGAHANNYGNYEGSMSNHHLVYENVVDVLNNKGFVATSGEDGLQTLKMIEKIL